MQRSISWYQAAAVVLAVGVASACSGSSDDTASGGGGGGSQIQALPSLAFSPTTITIAVGGNVSWVFGSVGHTVTFDAVAGQPADIGSVSSPNVNVTVSRQFSTAGVFTYHCSIHPSMTGQVIVGSNGVVPPPPPPPPPPPSGYLKTP